MLRFFKNEKCIGEVTWDGTNVERDRIFRELEGQWNLAGDYHGEELVRLYYVGPDTLTREVNIMLHTNLVFWP